MAAILSNRAATGPWQRRMALALAGQPRELLRAACKGEPPPEIAADVESALVDVAVGRPGTERAWRTALPAARRGDTAALARIAATYAPADLRPEIEFLLTHPPKRRGNSRRQFTYQEVAVIRMLASALKMQGYKGTEIARRLAKRRGSVAAICNVLARRKPYDV